MSFEDAEDVDKTFLEEIVQIERQLDEVQGAEKRTKVKQAIETIRSLWNE